MIKLDKVTKTFDTVTALRQFSLDICGGEILGLVGPDGAGKTTLLRLMVGAMTKFEGKIEVLGSENIEAVKHEMGYVPQKFSLYRDLTVMENINLIGALYGANQQIIRQKAEEILSFTGLWAFKDRLSDQLSGGMKQKLSLAAGLMHKPRLFFLDEPTTGVDPVARREFWQLLYNLNQEGMTIVVATPYMDEAELCHRVAFMNQGQLVHSASPKEHIAQYPHQILELSASSRNIIPLLADCALLDVNSFGDKYHLVTNDAARAEAEVTACIVKQGIEIHSFRQVTPTLEDVFVALAEEGGAQ